MNWLLILYFVVPVILRYLDTTLTIISLSLPPKLIAIENGASLIRLVEVNTVMLPLLETWYGNIILLCYVMVPVVIHYFIRTMISKPDILNFLSDSLIIYFIIFKLVPPVINNILELIWFLRLTAM